MTRQQTLTGNATDAPDCEHPDGCSNEAKRVLELREGESRDRMVLCDDCEFPEVQGALGAGVESERELTPREASEIVRESDGDSR